MNENKKKCLSNIKKTQLQIVRIRKRKKECFGIGFGFGFLDASIEYPVGREIVQQNCSI